MFQVLMRLLVTVLVLLSTSELIAQSPPLSIEEETRAYLSRLSPEEKARSDAYFEGGYWLGLVDFLYGVGIAWLLLGTGISRRVRDRAYVLTRRRVLRTALYAVFYILAIAVLSFPLTLYQGYFREHAYGLSNQTFGPWFKERLIALGIALVIFGFLLVVLYAVFRRAPRTWWVWGTVVSLAAMVNTILVAPVYLMPLFNDYRPLSNPELRESILSMARANGVPADEVYEFDASRQSKRISANVSGILGTMRISLNDNLLSRCTAAEVRAVMGHEMGHYVLNHAYEGVLFFGVILFLGFAFLRWSFGLCHRRWGERWGIGGVDDEAALPLLAALFSVFFFFLTPVVNSFVRANEAEADIFGLNASREPEGFAEVALKLGEYRKLDPGPVEEWLFFDHPSGRARIEMAMAWKAAFLVRAGAPQPRAQTPGPRCRARARLLAAEARVAFSQRFFAQP
jgi:STE24 endopeptidase